jgi:hypothetical protein
MMCEQRAPEKMENTASGNCVTPSASVKTCSRETRFFLLWRRRDRRQHDPPEHHVTLDISSSYA